MKYAPIYNVTLILNINTVNKMNLTNFPALHMLALYNATFLKLLLVFFLRILPDVCFAPGLCFRCLNRPLDSRCPWRFLCISHVVWLLRRRDAFLGVVLPRLRLLAYFHLRLRHIGRICLLHVGRICLRHLCDSHPWC